MEPEQAWNIVRQVCDGHPCNKADRTVIEQALTALRCVVTAKDKQQGPSVAEAEPAEKEEGAGETE